ncbi:terminase small subunit [Alcaligenes sp. 1735tsa3]|uniref:terminase small subunit n=1 Tax=Alcaligenes sp. 1735tsa3 TaxID=2953809 RepID=UPI0020A73F4F|nr:terminase small subunit [Alcaligenes sp. 1735tsa3]USY26697.1 terminase small subunit [Alcaligenes sp. 1735tsa3]
MKLPPKQARFAEEYVRDLNGTQAATRAGYSQRTANEQAARLLANVSVQQYVRKLLEERSQQVKIDAAYVLSRLGEIDQMDALDILADDGSVKPIAEWPRIWRQMISGLDVMEIAQGDEEARIAVVKKIKWPDKIKNLELIGRHVGVQAFKDRVEHSGSIKGMAERMRRRRKTEA